MDRHSRSNRHFVPDQIQLLAHHRPGLNATQVVQLVRADETMLDERLAGAEVSPQRVVTFDDGVRAFSLVFVDLLRTRGMAGLVEMVSQVDARVQGRRSEGGKQSRSLGEAWLRVDRAMPHWLASGAPENTGSGGPGARPVACGCPMTKSALRPWEFALPDALGLEQANCGAGADVAILDTVPSAEALAGALARWPAHDLLRSLLQPGLLEVRRADGGLPDLGLSDHPYCMSDHGLFAAGIVHAIAPKARLHLIEVLNEYGVGSFESIVRGLSVASRIRPARPLVVNCSFVLDVPQRDLLGRQRQRDPELRDVSVEQVENWGAALEEIWELLHSHGVHVVAAAGNDAADGLVPPARFPAAFKRVMGVAALNPGEPYEPANYSNKADRPVGLGIATFGGRAAGGVTDHEGGVLGVYIGDLPDGSPNEHGWARWSGTSFATPVISGALAALIGADRPDPVAELRGALVGRHSNTPIGEIFPVHQGTLVSALV